MPFTAFLARNCFFCLFWIDRRLQPPESLFHVPVAIVMFLSMCRSMRSVIAYCEFLGQRMLEMAAEIAPAAAAAIIRG